MIGQSERQELVPFPLWTASQGEEAVAAVESLKAAGFDVRLESSDGHTCHRLRIWSKHVALIEEVDGNWPALAERVLKNPLMRD